MAVAQDTFNQYRQIGFNGQVSTIDVADIVSGSMNSAVAFARAVVRGSEDRTFDTVTGSTTAGDVAGITVRTLAAESNSVPVNPAAYEFGYGEGEHASVLRRGRMYALCIGGASTNDTVHVVINVAGGDELGQLRGAADTTNTIELNQAKWIYDVADGEVGEIQLDGILATA